MSRRTRNNCARRATSSSLGGTVDITGRLLRLFGFNLDLCPVLDISFDDEADNSLRGRCYGRDVEEVVRLAGAFNDALRGQGIASCGKHFPGYSAATVDAHHDLPMIERTRAELDANELAVFRQFAGRVDSMMICHGWYPCFEPEKTAASLSRRIVTDLLRDELGFEGLIMTDDLDMGAILNEYGFEETIRRAIGAGNDLAMICHRVPAIEEAVGYLEELPVDQLERALENIARCKAKLAAPEEFSESVLRVVKRRDLESAGRRPGRRARRGAQRRRRKTLAGRKLLKRCSKSRLWRETRRRFLDR